MASKKELETEIQYLNTFRNIMETYEEIAASRMQKIRGSVLKSRDFVLEINSIFQHVKYSYKKQVEKLMKSKKVKDQSKLSFIKRNGKKLYVLISANTGLYGEVIRKAYDAFVAQYRKQKADVAIIGKLGSQRFKQDFPKDPYYYFDFLDTKIDEENLKKTILFLIEYQEIIVFYEQFVNVLMQEPIATNISGDQIAWEQTGIEIKYFFEPNLEKVLGFFEKEILASIFEQTLYESELAKFASRMISLDSAAENTKTKLKQMIFQLGKTKHRTMDKKQAESLTGLFLLKR
ncbi:MAG: F0F1 ATP synthase subunit gamma [Patescibacteria group bacterium]